jgi:hypothetical protein
MRADYEESLGFDAGDAGNDLLTQPQIDALILQRQAALIAEEYGIYRPDLISLGTLLAKKVGSLEVNADSAETALLHTAFDVIRHHGEIRAALKIFGHKDATGIQAARSALSEAGIYFDDSMIDTAILDLLERDERSRGLPFDRDAHRAAVAELIAAATTPVESHEFAAA